MNERPVRAAGIALLWQSFQMGGVKFIYMIRLLALAILLTPSDFGLFAIATAAMGFLMNLTNFGLIPALVQAESLDEAKYDAVWTFEISRSLLMAGLTIGFAPLIAAIFREPAAIPIIQIFAVRPIIESLTSIKVTALNRNLLFRPLAILKLVEAIFNAILSIGLASSMGVWAMVFGSLGGMLSMVIVSYFLAPYRPRLRFDWKAIHPLMNFGRWLLVTGMISMAGNYGLRIIISRQLGADGLGLYFLAAQMAFLPSEIASEMVGAVAFPLYARIQSNLQQAARAFHAIFTSLMALLYPFCALIIVLSPVLVQEILGSKWEGTVPLIRILALATMIGLLGDATIPLVKGFGQPYRVTLIELVQSSSLLVFIWVFTNHFGMVGAALAWLPTIIFVQILCVSFIKNIFPDSLKQVVRPFYVILPATIFGAALSALVISIFQSIPGLVLAAIVAIIVTGSILWVADRKYSLGLARNIVIAFPQLSAFLKIQRVEMN